VICRSGWRIAIRVGAVRPLFVSSNSVIAPSGSTTADRKYVPTDVFAGRVRTVLSARLAPPTRLVTLRLPIRVPAPGTLLAGSMKKLILNAPATDSGPPWLRTVFGTVIV